MTQKAAKWIFWAGTLTSVLILLVLTVDSHRQFSTLTNADKLDSHVVAGKHAFERNNCNDCHTILGFGGYYAPDLTRAYTRLGEDALCRRLKEPETAFLDSFRKMPQQHLGAQDIADMAAYFRWVSEIRNNDWPPQHSERRWKSSTDRILAGASLSPGAALILQEGCLECHTLGSKGVAAGQRMEWIARSRDAGWIAEFLSSPNRSSPSIEMPAYDHLDQEQRMEIAEFIVSLADAAGEK
jgi:nitric oxide reductase subunit C